MARVWTLVVTAALAVGAVGCGGSSPTHRSTIARAVVKFSIPQQVVAVPTDPPNAMEATIPVVARESAGVKAYIYQISVKATDEATGETSNPQVVRLNPTEIIPAGGSVEIPLRVYLPGSGPYRARVVLDASDAGGPSGTVPTGGVPADGSGVNLSVAVRTTFESDEFRILPPQ
jgi:hypothetical protein